MVNHFKTTRYRVVGKNKTTAFRYKDIRVGDIVEFSIRLENTRYSHLNAVYIDCHNITRKQMWKTSHNHFLNRIKCFDFEEVESSTKPSVEQPQHLHEVVTRAHVPAPITSMLSIEECALFKSYDSMRFGPAEIGKMYYQCLVDKGWIHTCSHGNVGNTLTDRGRAEKKIVMAKIKGLEQNLCK